MGRVISIGKQNYESMKSGNYFFVDKTCFIKEWWESGDEITLITRPRRFGKTLNMSMLECFFSNKFSGRSDLFEGLSIWEDEKYRELQGTFPVIFLSFADVKQMNYSDAVQKIKNILRKVYSQFIFLSQWDGLTVDERKSFMDAAREMDDVTALESIKNICEYLYRYYGKKVIILLDEYDTPMQEAWLGGYWDELMGFIRSFYNSTFKTNSYLESAVMTGITRISKESVFSDLNNLRVVTSTSKAYESCFGFTEKEVFDSMDEMKLSKEKKAVKDWYDGFTFGNCRDIYNPWSITNYLKNREIKTYWVDTSSNSLISRLLLNAGKDIKQEMETLITGGKIEKELDDEIVFNQLKNKKNAIWSLMVAGGYLSIDGYRINTANYKKICQLKITNFEVMLMFRRMIMEWFDGKDDNYNDFIKSLIRGNLKEMNIYMNKVALSTLSYFDTGKKPSETTEPERFYHGFVLGLLVDLKGRYEVSSNRESGYGRYDVCLIPLTKNDPGIVIEFKVFEPNEENRLEDTVKSALKQIKDRNYDIVLLERGVEPERIFHYGFAFEGKKVLIG